MNEITKCRNEGGNFVNFQKHAEPMWQIKLETYFSECRKVAHLISTLQLLSKDLLDCCLNLLLLHPTHRSTASETDQKMPLAF